MKDTPNEKEWFLYVVDHHEGPYSLSEIKSLVTKEEARPTSFVWREGLHDWTMISEVPEFGDGVMPQRGGPDMSGTSPTAGIWCLQSQKTFTGPYSMKTLIRKINDGEVSVQDSVWREGWTSFVSIGNIPEFMSQIKPDVLLGKKPAKKKDGFNPSQALGLAGGPSARSRKWYRSSGFIGFVFLGLLIATYQATVKGQLNVLLDKAGIREKVVAMNLPPIPFEKIGSAIGPTIEPLLVPIKATSLSLLEKATKNLPEPLKGYLSFATIPLPERLKPETASMLKELASSDPKNGVRFASALPMGEELNPSFTIVTNVTSNIGAMVVLKGKEGRLLNVESFEKKAPVEIIGKVGKTPVFSMDGNKPLPKGEYVLTVLDTTGQKVFATDEYFLGGRRDAAYEQRLQEFNDRAKAKLEQEMAELKQMVATLESMANESAAKFFEFSKGTITNAKKNSWKQYSAKYSELSLQLKNNILAMASTSPALIQNFKRVHELADQLHESETGFFAKKNTLDVVKTQATEVIGALNELKKQMGDK